MKSKTKTQVLDTYGHRENWGLVCLEKMYTGALGWCIYNSSDRRTKERQTLCRSCGESCVLCVCVAFSIGGGSFSRLWPETGV